MTDNTSIDEDIKELKEVMDYCIQHSVGAIRFNKLVRMILKFEEKYNITITGNSVSSNNYLKFYDELVNIHFHEGNDYIPRKCFDTRQEAEEFLKND